MTTLRTVADLHLHSRHSLATSPSLDLQSLAAGARRKGIGLLAAPDFTHPLWLDEMRSQLVESGEGVFSAYGALFILATEVSCIWRQDGRARRVHLLIWAPSIEAVDRMNRQFARYQNLASDGRPMLKLSARDTVHVALDADRRSEVIPAHVWTPWYGMYGSKSGFDSAEECFGDAAKHIHAIETGLSSDPAMNWRAPDVDGRAILSFSDAHSTRTMGRELTIFRCQPDFPSLTAALRNQDIIETVEFHPEHGKYHLDGHRKCGVRIDPLRDGAPDDDCPTCRKPLTLGVLNRVSKLASRPAYDIRPSRGLIAHPAGRPPFRYLVPLKELLSFVLRVGPNTKKVQRLYDNLVNEFNGELNVLATAPPDDLARTASDNVAQAIHAVRQGKVEVDPGYDGLYGSVTPRIEDPKPLQTKKLL